MSLRISLLFLFIVSSILAHTQQDSLQNAPLNMALSIVNNKDGHPLTVGVYAQIDYNQGIGNSFRENGSLDVHRLVNFLGYRFNDKTHFVTEIEFEHVNEVTVEQAFLNYAIRPSLSVRAGLMLIPMGIVNEYHEPTTFNGVERPNLDAKIIPTTWREIGVGLFGRVNEASLSYQVYVVNGFLSYNGNGVLRGDDGLRKGRQKGAQSIISHPNFSAKVDHYGIRGLKMGIAGYAGRSQSTLYGQIDLQDEAGRMQADSSTVGVLMTGFDFRYRNKGFMSRGQIIYSKLSDTRAYNAYTGSDLGSEMLGYYFELGYDLLTLFTKKQEVKELILFSRYENYDTHHQVAEGIQRNNAFNRTDITTGLTFRVAKGAVFKGDYQYFTNRSSSNEPLGQLNLGIGVWF
jgi:hypothetical protein